MFQYIQTVPRFSQTTLPNLPWLQSHTKETFPQTGSPQYQTCNQHLYILRQVHLPYISNTLGTIPILICLGQTEFTVSTLLNRKLCPNVQNHPKSHVTCILYLRYIFSLLIVIYHSHV